LLSLTKQFSIGPKLFKLENWRTNVIKVLQSFYLLNKPY